MRNALHSALRQLRRTLGDGGWIGFADGRCGLDETRPLDCDLHDFEQALTRRPLTRRPLSPPAAFHAAVPADPAVAGRSAAIPQHFPQHPTRFPPHARRSVPGVRLAAR